MYLAAFLIRAPKLSHGFLQQYFEYCLLHSGADLANMVNAAAIYAASEGDTSVTTRHLEFAKDKILMGKYFC